MTTLVTLANRPRTAKLALAASRFVRAATDGESFRGVIIDLIVKAGLTEDQIARSIEIAERFAEGEVQQQLAALRPAHSVIWDVSGDLHDLGYELPISEEGDDPFGWYEREVEPEFERRLSLIFRGKPPPALQPAEHLAVVDGLAAPLARAWRSAEADWLLEIAHPIVRDRLPGYRVGESRRLAAFDLAARSYARSIEIAGRDWMTEREIEFRQLVKSPSAELVAALMSRRVDEIELASDAELDVDPGRPPRALGRSTTIRSGSAIAPSVARRANAKSRTRA